MSEHNEVRHTPERIEVLLRKERRLREMREWIDGLAKSLGVQSGGPVIEARIAELLECERKSGLRR